LQAQDLALNKESRKAGKFYQLPAFLLSSFIRLKISACDRR